MDRLKDKLAKLNRIHLKKKSLKKTRFPSLLLSSGDKRDSKTVHLSNMKWPDIVDDTKTFYRKTIPSQKLEENISCLNKSFKNENGFFRIKRNMNKFWKDYKNFMKFFNKEATGKRLESRLGLSCSPKNLCFLDLETCGFSGSPLFLIGMCYIQNGNLVLDQLFARDYNEESAIISAFWTIFQAYKALVTFNGKSFDWPFLEERSFIHGQQPFQPEFHLDLLHESRRRWSNRLPDCKLQTLEKIFCRRQRIGDLPGSQIPQAYHDFVNNPLEPSAMSAAVHHTALDIITMAELVLVMLTEEKCVGTY